MHTSKLATLARAALAAAVLLLLSLTTHAQTLYYLHADHLNTPRLLTDQNQAVVWRWDQTEPFGDSMGVGSMGRDGFVVTVPLRFPGQYFDKETNLNYNYFRDYDPAIGRYVESDPIGLAVGINTYTYVDGNPLSFTDPLGLWVWGDPLDQDLVNAITGFGDAFLLPELIRNAFEISGGVNQCSAAYRYSKVAGFLTGSAPFALRGAA